MIATLFQSLNINTEDQPPRDQAQGEKVMQPVLFVMQNMMEIFTTIGNLWTKETTVIEVSTLITKNNNKNNNKIM